MFTYTTDEQKAANGWVKTFAADAKPGDILYNEDIDGVDFAMFKHTVLKVENGLIYSRENNDPRYIPLSQAGIHGREFLWKKDESHV